MHFRKLAAVSAAVVMLGCSLGAMPAAAAEKASVQIKTISFAKASSKKIKLAWSDGKDSKVKQYLLQRYDASTKKWKTIAKFDSDGVNGNMKYTYNDVLTSSAPQQYRYRVNVKVSDSANYKAVSGVPQYASNIKVCIDPGHYRTENGGTSGYTEGEATLKIGLAMKDYLKAEGISVYMTRTNENIKVGGLTNTDDGTQLNARGHAAKNNKCDMFISLHTNANNYNANGRDTVHQPSSLNKTVIFVNRVANDQNSYVVKAANKAGGYITYVNEQLGIPTNPWQGLSGGTPFYYCCVSNRTDDFIVYNDALKQKGRVIYRALESRGNDYYAVLRAASSDGVPGMLVEHSYHTVPAFCKKFMAKSSVAKYYALSDAKAIGQGYGFKTLSTI